jgi:mRNA interferase MazF
MKRGEIWWARLPKPSGSTPGFRHPVLVIQTDPANSSRLSTVLCATITSNIDRAKSPGNVMLPKSDSGLPKNSVVNVSQVITLDKQLLDSCVSSIPRRYMRRIDDGLRLMLDL